ncbi:MAG: recombinase family protein, partial [Bryobacteraceae bacterium]
MSLRCAAYARYSSDRQSPASIDDQLRMCREYAEKQGWRLVEEQIYTDRELSGAGADRPGWVKLLSVAQHSPRPFDVLLVDDTSRLCRNLGEMMRFTDEMTFRGIRVVAVSQGIDTESEQADVLMTVNGLRDSYTLKDIAQKTRRGLIGCVENGLHTGGRCYGYDSIPIEDHPNRKPGEAPPVSGGGGGNHFGGLESATPRMLGGGEWRHGGVWGESAFRPS